MSLLLHPAIALPRGRSLRLDSGPLVMGIINLSPDSFYPPSRRSDAASAAETALAMEAEGAAIVDLGGESTRPGSEYVGLDEELERVVPAVQAIRTRSDLPISVDTRKAAVAKAALEAGADMVNDISALAHDPAMAATCTWPPMATMPAPVPGARRCARSAPPPLPHPAAAAAPSPCTSRPAPTWKP